MSETNKLPIVRAVAYSWQFAATAWKPTLPAFLIRAIIVGFYFHSVALATGNDNGLGFFSGILLGFSEVVCMALTLRLAIRSEYQGFMGIQIGADEGRLFVANFLYGFLMSLAVLIAGFLVFALASAYLSTTIPDIEAISQDTVAFRKAVGEAFSSPTGTFVAIVMVCLFLLPLLFIAARLVTFTAATIARKKIMIFETWSWTKGYSFQIIIALIVTYLPFVVLVGIGMFVLSGPLSIQLLADPESAEAVSPGKLQSFLYGFGISILSIPIYLVGAGLSAFMYQGFNPERNH